MRITGLMAVVATAAFVASAATAATPKPSAATQLRTYLTKVQKPANQIASEDRRVDVAVYAYQQIGGPVWLKAPLHQASAGATAAAAALSHVKAPTAMKGPQALLVAGTRTFAAAEGKAADQADAADTTDASALEFISIDAGSAQGALQAVEQNWRDELVVQLRRAKITVPLWLKQVGK